MNTTDIAPALGALFLELVAGPPQSEAYILNPSDPGLLGSIEKLDAAAASRAGVGASSIAAHVDHVCYGLSLLNRWAAGENPWSDADWRASWQRTSVTEAEWRELRGRLRDEAQRWANTLAEPRDVSDPELKGMIGNVAHVAYHLGAIRQIDRAARGPSA